MPRRPSDNTKQVALRVPASWLKRAEELEPRLERPGVRVTRTDVLRAAIAAGLEALERESR